MNFGNSLRFVAFQEPIHKFFDNLGHVMFNSENLSHPEYPFSINDALEVTVNFPEYDEVDDAWRGGGG